MPVWLWNTAEDYHGMTANSPQLKELNSQKFAKDDPNLNLNIPIMMAQCTVLVTVLSKSVKSGARSP